MTHITCRLTAKNRDQLRNPMLCNRVQVTFTFFTHVHMIVFVSGLQKRSESRPLTIQALTQTTTAHGIINTQRNSIISDRFMTAFQSKIKYSKATVGMYSSLSQATQQIKCCLLESFKPRVSSAICHFRHQANSASRSIAEKR